MCSSELGSFSQVQGQCPSLGFGQGGGGQHPTGSRVRVRVTVTVRATVTASNPRPNAPAPCIAACVSSMCSLDRSYLALAQESRRLALEAARRCLVPCSRQLVRFAVRSACRTCTARIDCTVHSTAQHRMCTVPCIDSRLFVTSCSRRALRRSVRRSGGERACVRNTGPPHSRAACATHRHCLGTLGTQGVHIGRTREPRKSLGGHAWGRCTGRPKARLDMYYNLSKRVFSCTCRFPEARIAPSFSRPHLDFAQGM